MGSTNSCITTWNDSTCLIRLASIRPSEVSMNAASAISPSSVSISTGEYGTCTTPASARMITPCIVATVEPPAALPTMIAHRRDGRDEHLAQEPELAVPHDRDAEKIAVNRIVIAITPGNMNVRKSNPEPPGIRCDSPVPSTNRNRIGCASEVTIRGLFRRKRISSRFHTTFTARQSSASGPPARPGPEQPAPGSPARPRPPPDERVGRHPLGRRRLGVADRAAGVRHEHVVERRLRHATPRRSAR